MNAAIPGLDQSTYDSYLAALLQGDRAECTKIVRGLAKSGVDLKTLYIHLFERALYEVGAAWEKKQISVAVEHLATAITERMMTLVQPLIFSGAGLRNSRPILVACTAGEFHQVGGRMIADLCELSGWRGHFLGGDASIDRLLATITEKRPALLGLSLSIPSNLPSLLKSLDAVKAAHPDLPIVVGGQAFRFGAQEALSSHPTVRHIASFADLEPRLTSYERWR